MLSLCTDLIFQKYPTRYTFSRKFLQNDSLVLCVFVNWHLNFVLFISFIFMYIFLRVNTPVTWNKVLYCILNEHWPILLILLINSIVWHISSTLLIIMSAIYVVLSQYKLVPWSFQMFSQPFDLQPSHFGPTHLVLLDVKHNNDLKSLGP